MGDSRTLLNHYGIAVPFPTEWPAEKDESDASDDEGAPNFAAKAGVRRSRSRYTVLQRNLAERKSLVPGSEKTREGVENLVQEDEPDALGFTDSVARVLQQKGLPVQDDERLRNRFLLSSTTFMPTMYLSQVHSDASTKDLVQGLEFLSRSIDKKSASLKVLVESNFERFVKAKSVIDNVYTEMRNQGIEVTPEKTRPQSRHTSRTSLHFRHTSGGQNGLGAGRMGLKPPVNEKRKHALTKESDYGVQGIKTVLTEAAVKAEDVWGPMLGGRERENNRKSILESVEKSQNVLEVGERVAGFIKRKDYDSLIKEYHRTRDLANAAKSMADSAASNFGQLADAQVHQIVITARVWIEVEAQIEEFKRTIWRDLTSVQANLTMSTDRNHQEDHVALISVLLELGVEDNPIWVWLLSRYDYLKNKINSTFERSRVEIEILRRQLASEEKPSLYSSAIHLKSPTRSSAEDKMKHLDSGPILELWDLIVHAMGNLLSMQGGVLAEVVDFWDKARSFINGEAQRSLPVGVDGSSQKHHRLSTDGVTALQNGAIELVDILREHIFSFFADPPIEDVSALFSPDTTDTPNTPRTPRSATLSPFSKPDQRFNLDLLSPPLPSPKRGEAWEDFAFWPPYANSLSGVHYLSKLLVLLGTAASEMVAIQPTTSTATSTEKLKIFLNAARERSAKAICAAWNKDVQFCNVLEDWTRGSDSLDVTRMPSYFAAFEGFILSGVQKILYIPEAAAMKRAASAIVTPPPTKLLQMVRSQFVGSLAKALLGMAENAEKPINISQNPWVMDRDVAQANKSNTALSINTSRDVVDASTKVGGLPSFVVLLITWNLT